jgi:hypothetical protein
MRLVLVKPTHRIAVHTVLLPRLDLVDNIVFCRPIVHLLPTYSNMLLLLSFGGTIVCQLNRLPRINHKVLIALNNVPITTKLLGLHRTTNDHSFFHLYDLNRVFLLE